jgi:6-methylsalicylate decarboxylase
MTVDPSADLVDVHSHVLPDWYVAAAKSAGHVTPDGMPGWPSWSVGDHLDLMDRVGVGVSVLSISSPGVHFGDDASAADLAVEVNDFMAHLSADHPDRFEFFAALPLPNMGAAIAEARRFVDSPGCAGVGIESNAHGVYLGNPELDPLWQELAARRAIVFIHPTSPRPFDITELGFPAPVMEFLFDTTRSVVHLAAAGVLTRYPDIRFIVPHCGAALPAVISRIELFGLAGMIPDAPGDFGWDSLWFDLAGAPLPDQIAAITRRFGTGHLLYGSDYCFTPPVAVDLLARKLDTDWPTADPASWRRLTADNTRALFAHRGGREPR